MSEIAASSAPTLTDGNASGPVAHGMSGTISRPAQWSCLSCCAKPRCAGTRACGRHQAPAAHRTTGMLAALLDDGRKTVSGCYPAHASGGRGHDIPAPFPAWPRKTSTATLARSQRRTLASNATCCSHPSRAGRTACRTVGNGDHVQAACEVGGRSEISAGTRKSRTCAKRSSAQNQRHTARNVWCVSCQT